MLITIPTKRRTYLWNPADGSLTRLGELENALLAEVTHPMPPVCPTSLRYAVAKFDSAEVDAAYAALRTRFADAAAMPEQFRLTIESGTSPVIANAILRGVRTVLPGQTVTVEADEAVLAIADTLGFARA